jgi:hypothetical protein
MANPKLVGFDGERETPLTYPEYRSVVRLSR